jgi:hypothetical protein
LEEVNAMIQDLDQVERGGTFVRFIVGRYGSGKTFFLHLLKNVALQRKFVVLEADITTDRRLHGSGGKGRAIYTELMRNLATRSKPEGGALSNLIERWASDIDHSVRSEGGDDESVKKAFGISLRPLQEYVAGYDFNHVLTRYYEGFISHNQTLQDSALRWLRAEYTTKTEARSELGVRTIIDDESWYDCIKLFAGFCRIAGYAGLMVSIDELVVLSHRLANTAARNNNYEAILRIINDCMGGRAEGLGFLFAGTPDCIDDRRRGLCSYEALARRISGNQFARDGLRDLSFPVIRLENLTAEDCFVLLSNLRRVHAGNGSETRFISDDGISTYLTYCHNRMGASYFQTPSETIKSFIGLLRILEQNPGKSWQEILTPDVVPAKAERDPAESFTEVDDENLAEFKL